MGMEERGQIEVNNLVEEYELATDELAAEEE